MIQHGVFGWNRWIIGFGIRFINGVPGSLAGRIEHLWIVSDTAANNFAVFALI